MKYLVLVILKCLIIRYCDGENIEKYCREQFQNVINKDIVPEANIRKTNTLYLMENNKNAQPFNTQFKSMLTNYEVYVVPGFCPYNDVMATIIAAEHFGYNVINLVVTDAEVDETYLKSKDLIVLDYFEQITAEVFLCTSTNKVKRDTNGITEIINNTITSQATEVEPKEDNINDITKSTRTSTTVKYIPMKDMNKVKTEVINAENSIENSNENTICSSTVEGKIDASKIFSASLVDHTILYDTLVHFSEKIAATGFNTIPYLSVLVCIDDKKFDYDNIEKIKKFSKEYVFIFEKCEKVAAYSEHNILAALVAKPLPNEDVTSIPVIFYDTSELHPEHKMVYQNSETLHQNYIETLNYGIAEYFKKKHWNRIAVVSDDALDSDKFEENLHIILNKYNILNNIKPCTQIQCDFTKDLVDLTEANVRVIIANVDLKYASKLVKTATALNMTSSRGFIWIWREWPFESDLEASELGDVYSMFLTPNLYEGYVTHFHVATQLQIGNIIKGMEVISEIQKKYFKNKLKVDDEKLSLQTFHRIVYQEIQKKLSRNRNAFQIRKVRKELICTFLVSHPLSEKSFQLKILTAKPKYIEPQCSLPSYKFYDPCDDKYLTIILLVVPMFFITASGIYIFFNNLPMHKRYSHL